MIYELNLASHSKGGLYSSKKALVIKKDTNT